MGLIGLSVRLMCSYVCVCVCVCVCVSVSVWQWQEGKAYALSRGHKTKNDRLWMCEWLSKQAESECMCTKEMVFVNALSCCSALDFMTQREREIQDETGMVESEFTWNGQKCALSLSLSLSD